MIRMWDPTLARFTGIAAESAMGRPLLEIIPDLEFRGLARYFNRVLQEGAVELLAPAFHKFLIRCAPSSPSARLEAMRQRVTIAPLEDKGRIEGLIVTVEDVTARYDIQSKSARLDDDNWQVRNSAAAEVARNGAPETIAALLVSVRDHHHNLGLLNSALKVLSLTNVDTHSTLVEFLQAPDADLRLQSALALGLQKDVRAAPALIRALDDPNANVVYHAIEALGALRVRDACDALVAIAERRDFYLSFPAIEALGEIGDSRVAGNLVPLLQEELLREPTAQALAKVGEESTVPALAELLNNPAAPAEAVASSLAILHDRYERQFGEGGHIADLSRTSITTTGIQNLLDALPKARPGNLRALVLVLGWLDSPAAARALALHLGSTDLRNEIIEGLVRHGALVTGVLIEQLKSEDLEIRWSAVTALGRIRDAKAVPPLTTLLRKDPELAIPTIAALASIGDRSAANALFDFVGHRDDAVRRATVSALNTLASPTLVKRVTSLLSDPDALTRESAVRIAGYFGYRDCVDVVLARCRDTDERVRRAAIEHIPYLDDTRVPGVLTRALKEESPGVRAAAARALAHVESDEVVTCLIRALQDVDPWVRYFAARSLATHGSTEASDSLEALARSDRFPQVRIAAFEALSRVPDQKAVSVAESFIASGDVDLQGAVAVALKNLRRSAAPSVVRDVLRSPHASVRAAAANALGQRGNNEAVDDLRQLAMADADADVIRAAALALRNLSTPEGTVALIDVLVDPLRRDMAMEALTAPGDVHLDALRDALRTRSVGVRLTLVNLFERLKHPKATDLLRIAVGDADSTVKEAAAAAISRSHRQ
jgi:HEAT repeat protein